ncbi:MAG TPA: hypothetical protein EYP68_00500 [Candidatus Korarchaeota archaeon]|nr:hypothetical protein [Candidatus Korarchaeota archaeon]
MDVIKKGRLIPTLLTLTLTGIIFLSFAAEIGVVADDIQLPFQRYHLEPVNGILYPRIGAPSLVTPKGSFKAYLVYKEDEFSGRKDIVWKAKLSSLFSEDDYQLEIIDSSFIEEIGAWELQLTTPSGVPDGLYNLSFTWEEGGVERTEPNCVVVKSDLKELKIALLGESHFGIKRQFGFIAFSESLKDILRSAETLGFDLIIHTGDVIGNAYDEETFQAFYKLLVELKVPILLTLGNADWDTVEHNLYYWEKYLAPMEYSTNWDWIHFATINTDTQTVTDESLDWLDADLASSKAEIRVVFFQYAYWDVSPNAAARLPEIFQERQVDLVFFGQDGTDEVKAPPEVPVLTISPLTTHSPIKGGFRLVKISKEGIETPEKSIPNWILNVTYLQRNDGSSDGMGILVQLGQSTEAGGLLEFVQDDRLKLRILLILRDKGKEPVVEGAEIVWMNRKKGKIAIILETTVNQGEDKLVRVYQFPDDEPPSIELYPEVVVDTVTLFYELKDQGLGALDVKFFYSYDNKTWKEFKPIIREDYKFFRMKASYSPFYVKATVIDAAGNEADSYWKLEIPSLAEVPEETPKPEPYQPSKKILVVIPLILGAIVAAIIQIYLMRKK